MEENKYWPKFKKTIIIDGKQRKVIVNICGEIINDNPTDEELKHIKRYPGTGGGAIFILSEEERNIYLLEFLRYFYYKEGRVSTERDFINNPKYPSFHTYIKVFGGWNNAIREAGLQLSWGGNKIYTDEELLKFLIQFYEENGRPPTEQDFTRNPKYPHYSMYQRKFGSWHKALKIIGLDIDSMVRKGVIETNDQKARLGEIFVLDHFEEIGSIDLSGENKKSSCDGICPKGYNYDVKTSYFDGVYWTFILKNINIDKIEWFYLLAFNNDFTKLLFTWRIHASDLVEDIEKGYIQIGYKSNYLNNIENLREYEITEKIKQVFEKWRNNFRKWTKEEILEGARSKLKIYAESNN